MSDSPFVLGGLAETISTGGTNYTRINATTTELAGGGYVVTWMQLPSPSTPSDKFDVYAQIFDADGNEVGSNFLVNTTTADDQSYPQAIGLAGGGFVITWQSEGQDGDGSGIYAQRYDAAGVAQGSETLVNTTTTGEQRSVEITDLANGGYAIAWAEEVDNGDGTYDIAIKYQQYTSTGALSGSETTLTSGTANFSPSFGGADVEYLNLSMVQLTGGELAISWTYAEFPSPTKVQMMLVDNTGTIIPGIIEPEQQTDQTGTLPQQSVVALGNGNLLVVYGYTFGSTGSTGTGYGEIYGRIYDATGAAVGNEFAIVAGMDNRRFDITATSDGNGGAIIGYYEEADTTNEGNILLQQVLQDGTLQGGPIHVDPQSFANGSFIDATTLANGDIVVSWQTGGQGSVSEIAYSIIRNGTDARFSDIGETVVLNNTGEHVHGLGGEDTITGGTGDDVIGGGADMDAIYAGEGADVIDGGDDDDILHGDAGNDLIFGGAGNDTILGGADEDNISGGDGDDTIDGGSEDDYLYGGAGADTINGGDGSDHIYGYDYQWYNLGPQDTDRDLGVTNTLNGGDGDDFIYGGWGDDIINGGDGDDQLVGGDFTNNAPTGDDMFIGSSGNDTIRGGDGEDTADYSSHGAGITVAYKFIGASNEYLEILMPAVGGNPQYAQKLYEVEAIIGTAFDDVMTGLQYDETFFGGAGIDILDGGDGEDRLDGGENSDQVFGGLGNDIVNGGLGVDTVDGGDGIDTLDLSGATNAQTVNLVTNVNIGGFAHNDTFISIENVIGSDTRGDDITGTAGANTLSGMGADDILRGFNGDDILEGGENNDYLYGGRGADVLDGGNGLDWAMYNDADHGVIVDLNGVGSGGIYSNGDTYVSIERVRGTDFADTITMNDEINKVLGGDGNDFIYGLGGKDSLRGGNDSDTLNGGADNDSLFGDAGADFFEFELGSGADWVADFENDIDTIVLDSNLWTGSLSFQEIVDTYGNQINLNRIDLDFGNGDIVRIVSDTPIAFADLYDDLAIL